MKTQKFIFWIVFAFAISLSLSFTAPKKKTKYYWAFDKKTDLFPQKNTLMVKFVNGLDEDSIVHFLKKSDTTINVKWLNPKVLKISTTSSKLLDSIKMRFKKQKKVVSIQPNYELQDGLEMGVTNYIVVKFLAGITEQEQDSLKKRFGTKVIKKTKIYQKLIVPKGTDALEIANEYYETGMVKFSTPDFISQIQLHQVIPNDTYFKYQFDLYNTGQTLADGDSGTPGADIDAPDAWGITTGNSNITIAVLDEGVTSNHPDLPNSRQIRLNGSNFGDGDPNDPSPTGDEDHGNACAGVIAATMNNNQGIAGIAPNCKIMPIRIFNSGGTGIATGDIADAIEFAVDNGANILSDSWGYNSSNPNLYPVIVSAIQYAVNHNCVVVFSAGNTADHVDNNNGYVAFPACVNIDGVITVGASDRYDKQSNYSPSSSLIDIAAPSHRAYPCNIPGETFEMWSLDIPGSAGYNPWKFNESCMNPPPYGEVLPSSGTNNLAYTGRFGGTSHSCPVVAGVAALVLSENPTLSNIDVFNILKNTADKVGGYEYTNGHSNEFGYGRVNAYKAVLAAMPSTITGPSPVCTSGSSFTLNNPPPNATVNWTQSSNLTYVSGQGTDYYTVQAINSSVNGMGWVKAIVNSSCGNDTIEKKAWVGVPATPTIICPFSVVGPNSLIEVYAAGAGADSYNWTVAGGTITSGQGTSDIWIQTSSGTPVCPVDLYITLTTSNACGNSIRATKNIPFNCSGGPNPLLVSPNPASQTLNVEVTDTTSTATSQTVNEAFTVQLLNAYNRPVYQRRENSKHFSINVSKYNPGIYYLRVIKGNQIYSKKVVIATY